LRTLWSGAGQADGDDRDFKQPSDIQHKMGLWMRLDRSLLSQRENAVRLPNTVWIAWIIWKLNVPVESVADDEGCLSE
jgi:hypothetical protein